MANTKLTDKQKVTTMADSDYIFGNFGGKVGQMSIPDFRSHLNDNDNQVLNNIAFYIDVNSASSLGASRVDTGGNLRMRAMLEASEVDALMDKNGNPYDGEVSFAWQVYNALGEPKTSGTSSTVTVTPDDCKVVTGDNAYYSDCDVQVTAEFN